MGNKPVLVIRPLREKDAFLELLKQASIAFNYIPIMRIQPILETDNDFQAVNHCIGRLGDFDYVIVISANAAEIGLPLIAQSWPLLPRDIEFFAVGQQSADIFSEFNYPVSFPKEQPNTEGLLHEMPQLQNLQGKSVLILRGGQGRQTLGDELVRRGASIEYCELYQRQIQPQKLAEAKKFMPDAGCLVVHSGELLDAMNIAQNKHIPLIVPSDRIAFMAHEMGWQNVQVAENALPDSMFNAVIQLLGVE